MLLFFLWQDIPRSLLEALATAGAGIASDAASHREMVVHGAH